MTDRRWFCFLVTSFAAFDLANAVPPPEKTTFTNLGMNSHRFDWLGTDGWTCFSQYSVDLKTWLYLPEIDQGVVHDPIDVCPLDDNGNIYPRCFFRLKMSDFPTLDPKAADFDGDGASNWLEITGLGTDPLKADSDQDGFPDGQTDTDGDGMSDQWEMMLIEQSGPPGTMGIQSILPGDDDDHDGVTNYQEYIRGFNGYQTDSDGDGYSDRLSVDQELNLRLDESTGTVVKDDSGQNRNGVLVASAGWQPTGGTSGGALEFHGGNDAVELPAGILDGRTNLTVSLWFKTSSTSVNQTLFSSASAAHSPELAVSLENGGTVRFDTGGGLSVTWIFGRSLADGLWHHLAVTRDATAQNATLHLDGAAVGLPQAVTLAALDVDAVTLGQRYQSVSTYQPAAVFTGMLDEVRVYSVVLEPSHLKELFQANDLDQDGVNPLVGAPVTLSQLEPSGSLETLDGGTLATSLTLKTDSAGKVAVHFKAN